MELAAEGPTGTSANCSSSGHQGVDPKLLGTFPILAYSAVKISNLGNPPRCSVMCLSEFNHHDTLRLLPKCNHVFHPPGSPLMKLALFVARHNRNSHQVLDENSESRSNRGSLRRLNMFEKVSFKGYGRNQREEDGRM